MKRSRPTDRPGTRRAFLKKAGTLLPAAALVAGTAAAQAAPPFNPNLVTDSDVAVLKFLAALELIEEDLWQQYSEVAVDNVKFKTALYAIDPALVRYITQDRDDERSHAAFINAFLVSLGEPPVNLDAFRTLPSLPVQGARTVGRLTNLRAIKINTSWYLRYRGGDNPDLGGFSPEFFLLPEFQGHLLSRPVVPTNNSLTQSQVNIAAANALLHFALVEQAGSSLYVSLISKVTHLDVVSILSSIAPVEFCHFAVFSKVIERIGQYSRPVFERTYGAVDTRMAEGHFPAPAQFLDPSFPLCSVVRPRSTANAGAVATTTAMINSNLFLNQSGQFLSTINTFAQAADAAQRSF